MDGLIYDKFVTFDPSRSTGNQEYAICPFHAEDTPSFTVNTDTGEWYCHACCFGGGEREFLMRYFDVPQKIAERALRQLRAKGTLPFPTEEQVEHWHEALLSRPREIEVLEGFGITVDTINDLMLGWDDTRIVFPIKSKTGYYVNARKYLPPHRRIEGGNNVKCLHMRGLGSNRYYPYKAFDEDTIYIVEGEKDCASARSQGLNAVTGIGGSSIPVEEVGLFHDKTVYVMLDTDTVGKRNLDNYKKLLRTVAKEVKVVDLPYKDYVECYEHLGSFDVEQYTKTFEEVEKAQENVQAQEVSLVKSEFTENLNTWMRLENMSVVGVEPRVYTIPTKLRVTCHNNSCQKMCPLRAGSDLGDMGIFDVDYRQMLQFVDASDSAQDRFVRKVFGCKSVSAEPEEMINVQKVIFQESASFVDGLEDATFENRYGIYLYTDYRLSATLKYNFEACRVTDPGSQQNYYVIRKAESVSSNPVNLNEVNLAHFQKVASDFDNAMDLIEYYYDKWMPLLGIEERADLFGAILLTYCSVTEIPWQMGLIKGWLDVMVMGDTRTGKSQMAQRFVKSLGMGAYINGENARSTGVIGGVQRFGDSWVVTWGAIPMNDKGLLIIDEASGLDVEDVKNLSSTRSSGAVTLNKIVKGEARARTRLLWLSNPRSGRNLSDFYWKGYGAFQEFIPVVEDQARFDMVLSAAREDVDVLVGFENSAPPNTDMFRQLFRLAWSLPSEKIHFQQGFAKTMRTYARDLNDKYGGGPLVVGVAVHEKLLRLACAFAVLCGNFVDRNLEVTEKHLKFACQFLQMTLEKNSFGYNAYIKEFKRSQAKKSENMDYIRGLITLHPALKTLLSSSGFKGYQFQEILGIDRSDSSKMMSDLITRGLLRISGGATYVPDKMLMDVAKQMEV